MISDGVLASGEQETDVKTEAQLVPAALLSAILDFVYPGLGHFTSS